MEGAAAGNPGAPVITLRVTVRVPDLEAFIDRYSKHIDGDRLFIFTKNPQPVGTRVQFTLQLASGEQLIHGKGTVTRVQHDVGDRHHPPGMELIFVPLDDRSQTLVDFLLATRDEDAPPLMRAVAPDARPSPAPPPPPAAEIGLGDSGDIDTEDTSPKATVMVTSNPPGAVVLVDGVPQPQPTPTPLEGLDPAKVYEVKLVLPGYKPFNRRLRPRSGEKLHALLFPIERVLEVSSTPPGAEVFLDGRRAGGVTPFTVRRVDRAKDHELELRLAGHHPHKQHIAAQDAFEQKGDREVLVIAATLASEAVAPTVIVSEQVPEPVPDAPPPAPASVEIELPVAAMPPPIPESPLLVPAPAIDSGNIALALAEHLPPKPAAEIATGPAPAMVEKWRESLPPGAPAAGTDNKVPANPFSEVSDGAIEYFVEWSLEQSIGPRAEQTSQFSGVAMALPKDPPPGLPDEELEKRPRRTLAGAMLFAAGLTCGAVAMWFIRPAATASATPPPTVAAAPVVPAPSAAPAPPPSPSEAAAAAAPKEGADEAGQAELSVTTRPAGATITVDGQPAGESPVTVHVAAGKHEISATKERYQTATSSTEAPGNAHLTLERPMGKLRIVSTPPGAQIAIAGEVRGRTPAELKLPAFESYDIRVELAGNQPWRRSVYLHPPLSTVQATLIALRPQRPPVKPAAPRR